jgi:hypothetical protein
VSIKIKTFSILLRLIPKPYHPAGCSLATESFIDVELREKSVEGVFAETDRSHLQSGPKKYVNILLRTSMLKK